ARELRDHSWPRLISHSATPLIAETTTTTRFPASCVAMTRRATFMIRSGLPTDVPPYFWTIRAIRSGGNSFPAPEPCQRGRVGVSLPCRASYLFSANGRGGGGDKRGRWTGERALSYQPGATPQERAYFFRFSAENAIHSHGFTGD